MQYYRIDDSPVGPLFLAGNSHELHYLLFDYDGRAADYQQTDWVENFAAFQRPLQQLDEYFSGKRHSFDLRLAPKGTAFQRQVWQALAEIPYGQTATYSEIAANIGRPKACRAVGMANGKNPISIIVPCHRVIGASGKLVGYGGGLNHKEHLLRLEGVLI